MFRTVHDFHWPNTERSTRKSSLFSWFLSRFEVQTLFLMVILIFNILQMDIRP
ncbi:hypothetical protein BDF20DRAFT_841408 [Mycotypha africana]|uniref:uncharacterized protein n=1 Tax=Mycotypha africana TaxID=64632 RepID=UPI002300661F|nr:uncharacterized protein BDF20DRAFT_841408 [Mycotypha africana]KAI8990900.1 hypothetical protein BDF20DRAFT_841408 [Mycotypha africana]